MKVALIHDWLTGMRGGEQCLQAFLRLYPEADVYTLIHVKGKTTAEIDQAVQGTSFFQKLPAVKQYYRCLLPLFSKAINSIRLPQKYDLVISLSHAAAKNITVPEGVPHLCYCFTPMRYIWDQVDSYLGILKYPAWPLIKFLRQWDFAGAQKVDQFIAISKFVAARIRCFYNKDAYVVYPPVDTAWIESALTNIDVNKRGDYFLCAGALVPYKRIDLAVKLFNQTGEKLIVAGSGPELAKLKRIAKSNITFLGRVSNEKLAELYAGTRALIFPGVEDFGMMPVECLAAGRPVIGFASGGLLETINAIRLTRTGKLPELSGHQIREYGFTGVLTDLSNDKLAALRQAVEYFKLFEPCFCAASCRHQATKFGFETFRSSWERVISECGIDAKAPIKSFQSAA